MRLGIERQIFHENRPYRYHIYDGEGQLLWICDREEPWRIWHTRRMHFRTPEGEHIARLEPQRGEYSDWARAPRYCYDPRTLGNLVWP